MSTELKYLNDTYLFDSEAKVITEGIDDRGKYVVFSETIFYPQGGGQPSDTGHVEIEGSEFPVTFVAFNEGFVRHYIPSSSGSEIQSGMNVTMSIDRIKRLDNARTHSAGHLLSHIVEEMYDDLIPIKGYHFPGGAHVEFLNESRHVISEQINELNEKLAEEIAASLEINAELASYEDIEAIRPHLAPYIPKDKPSRIVKIGSHRPLPCGGTHPANLTQLGTVKVTKAKNRKGTTKLSYEMGGPNFLSAEITQEYVG